MRTKRSMPSLEHDVFVKLVRDRPAILRPLLAAVGVDIPEDAYPTPLAADFSSPVVEYHADLVVGFGRGSALDVVVIVEVQLAKDPRKLLTWPLYEALARVRHAPAATAVLVLTPDTSVAAWAGRSVTHRAGVTYTPLVLGPAAMPHVTQAEPELLVLSALAHANEAGGGPVLEAAILAVEPLGKQALRLYLDLLQYKLGSIFRRTVEKLMQATNRPYLSDWFNEMHEKGVADGERDALYAVLQARGISLSRAQRDVVDACSDPATVRAWVIRAATASSAEDVLG